jgi:hypothetical protein
VNLTAPAFISFHFRCHDKLPFSRKVVHDEGKRSAKFALRAEFDIDFHFGCGMLL